MTFDQQKISRAFSQNDTLEQVPDLDKFKQIMSLIKAAIPEKPDNNRRLDGLFNVEQFWGGNAAKGLSAPIGWLKDSDEYAYFQLLTQGHPSVHGLMGGATGSGKSNLLHVLVHSLCWQYSPDELNLYLLDFKDGAAFRHYTDTNQSNSIWLPHVKSISASNDPEYALSLFEFLNAERKRRNRLFAEAGNIDKYEDYRALDGGQKKMPRILVVIDEFQVMFDGATGEKIAENLTSILKQGRSVGIHMLLATQTLASMHVSGLAGMKGQLQLRISLNGSGDEQVLDDAVLAHSIIAKKECIINENFGAKGCDSVVEVPRVSFSNNVVDGAQGRKAVFNGEDAKDQEAEFVFQGRVCSGGFKAMGCFDDGRELPSLPSSEWLADVIQKHDDEALDNASSSSGLLLGMDTAFRRSHVFAEMEDYFNGHLLVAWNDGDMDPDGRVTGAQAEKGLMQSLMNSISASGSTEAVYYDPAQDESVMISFDHVTNCGKATTDDKLTECLKRLADSTCPNKFFIVENFNRARNLHPVEAQPMSRSPISFARPGSTTAGGAVSSGGEAATKSPRELFLTAFKDQDRLPFHVVLSVKNFEAARKNVLARVREHNLFEGCSQRIAINLSANDLATFIPIGNLRSKNTAGKAIYADINSGNIKFFMPFKPQG